MQAEKYSAVWAQSICPANCRKDRNAIKRWFLVAVLHLRTFSSHVKKPRIVSLLIRKKSGLQLQFPIQSAHRKQTGLVFAYRKESYLRLGSAVWEDSPVRNVELHQRNHSSLLTSGKNTSAEENAKPDISSNKPGTR